MNNGNDWIKPLLFVIATYVLSWSIFFFAGDNMILTTVGTCMPSIVGIVFLLLSKSDARKGMKKRIIGFRSTKRTCVRPLHSDASQSALQYRCAPMHAKFLSKAIISG